MYDIVPGEPFSGVAISVSILHLHQLGEKRPVPDDLVEDNFIIPLFNRHDNLVFLVTLVNQFHAVPLSLKNKRTLLDGNMIPMGKKYLSNPPLPPSSSPSTSTITSIITLTWSVNMWSWESFSSAAFSLIPFKVTIVEHHEFQQHIDLFFATSIKQFLLQLQLHGFPSG